MQRILEAELMEDETQVRAYAEADFSEPHGQFVERLQAFIGPAAFSGVALDLGCGPGDISRRLVEAYPGSRIDAVDGSAPMLAYARANLAPDALARIRLIHGKLPDVALPEDGYELMISNSLLHHLPDPMILWRFIKRYAKAGTRIAVMDLIRPESVPEAQTMVARYAEGEPEILQHDFYHSLLAAFTLKEITRQLQEASLQLSVTPTSDRHVLITGQIY